MQNQNILIPEETISFATSKLAGLIKLKQGHDRVLLLGILRGAFIFTADLARALNRRGVAVEVEFFDPHTNYTSAPVAALKAANIEGRLLAVDTIATSGDTLKRTSAFLGGNLKCCVLLHPKYLLPDGQVKEAVQEGITIAYSGLRPEFPVDAWVEGYGLDNARGLPFIRQEEEAL